MKRLLIQAFAVLSLVAVLGGQQASAGDNDPKDDGCQNTGCPKPTKPKRA